MKYIQVENNIPINYYDNKPRWFHDDKSEVSDEWLKDNENIYPFFEEHENDSKFIGKPSSDWEYREDCVIKTYFSVIDEYPIKDNYITQKYVLNNESDWIIDGDIIKRTYSIEDRPDDEIEIFLVNKLCYEEPKNPDEWLLKPPSLWKYSNDIVYKTYWKIIRPSDIDSEFSGIFNHFKIKDSNEWIIRSEEEVEVTYTIEPNSIDDIKNNSVNALATIRYLIEIGGVYIDINGKKIAFQTDRESQTKITSLFLQAQYFSFSQSIGWKAISEFVVLSKDDIVFVFNAIQSMIQHLFNSEMIILERINNADSIEECKKIFDDSFKILYIESSIYLQQYNKDEIWQYM